LVLLPMVSLSVALLAAGGVVALVGQDPLLVIQVLVQGAFGTARGFSYTLYYATTFVFTGLAVAVAFHGGLFNIGGEGQAVMGGLGTGLVALWWSAALPAWLMLPLMMASGALFGLAWAAVPAYLQAYRGSHVVITTIMFNFIASSVLVYLLVNHLRPSGVMSVESASFSDSAKLPGMHQVLGWLGMQWPASPLNLSVLLAALAAVLIYLFLWRTRAGYRLRAVGASPSAAEYAGINARHQVLIAMSISGALAGLVGMNEIAGVSGKLVVMLQGFIVLFSGAMTYVIAQPLARVLRWVGVAHG
jgi:simple sugar transport system permease protein